MGGTWVRDERDGGGSGLLQGGDLIAAGSFTEAGGQPAGHIARWDGTGWHALGGGLSGSAALIVHEDRLIAGGGCSTPGSGCISAWDGTSWHPMGSLPWVSSFAVWNGDLYAAGGEGLNRWNGTGWDAVNLPSCGLRIIHVMCVWNDRLVLGGLAGSEVAVYPFHAGQATRIGSWDREEDAYIYGAAVADGALLLAGQFPTGAGRRAVVMRYQQGSWTPLGSWTGEDYYAYAVAVYKGHVVAGGHFPGCYTRPYQPGAGRWDGSSWRPMGAVNDDPEVFLVWDGALIMGGQFDFADNSGVNCIARWREGE